MVFSFFKKQQPGHNQMPKRVAARPRVSMPENRSPSQPATDVAPLSVPMPDLEFSLEPMSPKATVAQPKAPAAPAMTPAPAPAPAPKASPDPGLSIDDFETGLTDLTLIAIDEQEGGDPLQADIEQVVVIYANGQDAAARSLVESLLHAYPQAEARRFWLLLFDLLQAAGDRQAFDRRCAEYAQLYEMSPPTWRDMTDAPPVAVVSDRIFQLHGVLTVDDTAQHEELKRFISKDGNLLLDFSRLVGCDDEVAGRLADTLIAARRANRSLDVAGAEVFLGRLGTRLVVGDAQHEPAWRLLLELLQRTATQAQFEERAVDYAVTFELSPPSWETVIRRDVQEALPTLPDDAFYLSGDIRSQRFEALLPILEGAAQPIIDFSAVRRLDFYSAGQLVNRLAPFKAAGKEILVRSPSHLVAELMAVVGLNKQARIVVPKF